MPNNDRIIHLVIGQVLTKAKARDGLGLHSPYDWLCRYFEVADPGGQFRKFGAQMATRSLMDAKGRFLTGYVPDLIAAARQAGFWVTWEDHRRKPEVDILEMSSVPFDYQRPAIEAAVRKGRGILWIPTGGGKTVCAAEIMRRVRCSWLFLAHRRELCLQAAERFKEFTGEDAGWLIDGKWHNPEARVLMCTLQTMHSWRDSMTLEERLWRRDGVIVDEAHTVAADTFLGVMKQLTCYYRIGLTGTPYGRSDSKDYAVVGATGPVIYHIDAPTLIEAGKLAQPTIRMWNCHQPYKMQRHDNQRLRAKEWRACEKACILDSEIRNGMIVDLVVSSDKPCIVFVSKLAHGSTLVKALRERGISSEFVNGKSRTCTRRRALERLAEGEIEVVIGTTIFDEGIDVPEIATVVLAGGGKSPIKNIQRIGRGMRVTEDKNTVDIHDIWDSGNATLRNHSRTRKAAFEQCGYEVEIVK